MPQSNRFSEGLIHKDPVVFHAIEQEYLREEEGIELIASENYVSQAVLEAQGSILTNKYAEGYPGKRYYGGCAFVDIVETLAIERAKQLFQVGAANVQAHSGSQANMATYLALMKPGDLLMGMALSHGGHLTHGSPINFSGSLFRVMSYGLDLNTERLDYDQIRDAVRKNKPKVLVVGASAYPRIIDFKVLGEIATENHVHLVADIAHIAGLVVAGIHPSPIPYATYTTSTTHKTLRGPRGGLILGSVENIQKVNASVFPGIQGGPLMHVIAAKAVAFGEGLTVEFQEYQKNIVSNAKVLAEKLMELGCKLVTDGTDTHLILVDLRKTGDGELTGKEVAAWLDLAGITVNKNTIPNEHRSPFITSGIRLGTPAITTRGFGSAEMQKIAQWIYLVLQSAGDVSVLKKIREEVQALCRLFPVYRKI